MPASFGPDHGRTGRSPLSTAQQRAITDADPDTGEVHASASTTRALTRRGLAVATGRLGAIYLTEAGRAERARLQEAASSSRTPPPQPEAAVFTPAFGGRAAPPGDPDRRAAEVRRAWLGVEEARRLADPDTPGPAPWERARPGWSVALALEAAGLPPSVLDETGRCVRAGYQVTESEPDGVRVHWHGPSRGTAMHPPQELTLCADQLKTRGWPSTPYRAPAHHWFLHVTPDHR